MSEDQNKKSKNVIWQLAGFLVVVAIVVIGSTIASSYSTTNKKQIEEKVNEIIKEKNVLIARPKCDLNQESFESLKNSDQSLTFIQNKASYAQNNSFIGAASPTVIITGQDEIACGYLYIRASKSNKPLDEKSESIYINPQGFGGHILRSKGIYLKQNAYNTEALISLDSVAYLPNVPYNPDAKNFRIANWTNLLNVNSHVTFSVGLSTLDKGGMINEITIAYKCWNSETGNESKNCQLSL